jgi:16S rRNA (adenine1518-N6/adenine1519-N6)-dimethyltransferase
MARPGHEVDVLVRPRRAPRVEVERPAAAEPETNVRLPEQPRELANERELSLGRGVHRAVVSLRLPAKIPVSPRRELGQHFLVDENILGVIGRLAELDSSDVVLEVGPGLGILTRYLADRVARVHAVEIDRSLAPRLAELPPSVELEFGDALAVDLGRLEPTKLVANLPYSVATPLVVESLDRLPTVRHWCVMVQREVADRFFAEPGTKAYGAVSVLVQLAAKRTGSHPVARTVFRPQPNVDSALVAFRRVPRPEAVPWRELKRVVEAAFAHRRKTLPNSLQLAGVASRERAADALVGLGRPARTRAEALAPAEFVELVQAL